MDSTGGVLYILDAMLNRQDSSPTVRLAASPTGGEPPVHDELSWLTRAAETTFLVVAAGLWIGLVARLVPALTHHLAWLWLAPVGAIAADFVSGLVHWTADTWGSETMPVLGRRFVRPFRVHHVNPDDFLRRGFIDCNGDVAMLTIPILVVGWLVPFDHVWGLAAGIFIAGFVAAGMPTNQVHQWAHMRRPPRLVRWLQRRGLILSRSDHLRHHRTPYVVNYCIATGWCNRPLAAIRFFHRLELAVTRLTGLRPRDDDASFATAHQASRTRAGGVQR